MKEREKLFQQHSIKPEERIRLREIADELSSLPTAERVEDLEAMRIIRQAAADIQTRQGDRK